MINYTIEDAIQQNAVIKVIGVGGGGGNAVRHMIDLNIQGVEFIVANTDAQALKGLTNATVIQLGTHLTKGLGAGADPKIGEQAAIEDREIISNALKGADMVFITAGMGGGTGTGAAPIVASIAKELGVLTVAVVTKPFQFEGKKRSIVAEEGTQELKDNVDSLIAIPNTKLQSVLGKVSIQEAFAKANDILRGAVQGIADLIIQAGLINVDFADVRTVMSEMGMAMMGSGVATGENRAIEATEMAIRSPLLDDIDLYGAKGVLVNISGGSNLGIDEYTEIGEMVQQFASDDATVVIGTALNSALEDEELRVTVVVTGLEENITVNAAKDSITKPVVVSNNVLEQRNRAPSNSLFDGFETQAQTRKQRNVSVEDKLNEPLEMKGDTKNKVDFLDVPTFLRKTAD